MHPACSHWLWFQAEQKVRLYHFKYVALGQNRQGHFQNSVQSISKHSVSLCGCLSQKRHPFIPKPLYCSVLSSLWLAGCLLGSTWLAEPCLSRKACKTQQVKGGIVFWPPARRSWETNVTFPLEYGVLQKYRNTHFSEKQKTPSEDCLFSMYLRNPRQSKSSRPTMVLSSRNLSL